MRRSSGVALVLAVIATLIVPIPTAAQGPTSPPGTPTGVIASSGTLSATVTWTPAGSPADSFTVTSTPSGISATVSGTSTNATVTGLGFLTSYTFSVTANNALGAGLASAQSNAITPDPPGGPYHQGFAIRLLNQNITAGKPVATNLGDDPVHLPGLSAVVVNVTASQATASTTVQVVVNQQVVQTIPVAPGQVESSLTVIGVPAQLTQAAIQMTTGTAHVQLDFVGYFTGPKTVRDHSGMLEMIAPATLLDASVAAGSTTNIPVLGQGDVPATGVAGVLLNVVATGATAAGALALRPSGAFATGITTLGFAAGQTTANRAIVAVPSNGALSVVDTGAEASVHVDVLGWFTDGSDKTALGSLYTAVSHARLLDTSALGGPVPAGGSVNVGVWGHGGAPAATSTAPPTSALFGITEVAPAGPGLISVSGEPMIPFAAGQTVSGTVLAHLAGDGSALVQVSGSAANVTVDLLGYFSGDLIVPGSTKVLSPALLAGITSMGADLSITFAPGTQVSPPIQLNDVINAGISPTTPKGFLRRVLNITTLPSGAVVLGTRYALLSEALTAFTVDWVPAPKGGSLFGAYSNGPRSTMTVSPPMAAGNPFPPPPLTSIDPNYPLLALATPSHPITASIGAGAEVSLTDIEVQVLPHVYLAYNFFTNTAKAAFGFSEGVRLSADFTITKDLTALNYVFQDTDKTIPIAEPIPIPIGPIVVVITPVLVFVVTLDASISVGLTITYHFDKFVQVTESYDGSQFHTNQLAQLYADGVTPPEVSANADLKLAAHTSPGIDFYDLPFFSALVDLSRYVKFSASLTCSAIPLPPTCGPAAPWWTVSTGVCLGVAMNLDLILIKKFFSQQFLCIDVVIAHAPGLKLDVQIVPATATVSRFQVQHFQAAVTNSPGGVTWSLPGGSASGTLSNTNLSDADYTAPGRAGQYKVKAAANADASSFIEAVITVPPTVPSSPSGALAGLTGPTSMNVTWNPPADDGGVALTGYQVTSSPGGIVVGVGATTQLASFTGLTPGTLYTFTVTASNSAGLTSAPSAPSPPIQIPPAGPMSVTPTTISFGAVTLGQSSAAQTVVVTPDGVPLAIASVALAGTNPGEFAIQSDSCTGQTIQPGNTCSFNVLYTPTAQIAASGVVTITDSDSTSPQSVTLTGSSPVQAISGVVPVPDIQMIDSQTGYAVEAALGTVLLKTTDGGKTWNRLALPGPDQVNIGFGGYSFRFIDAMHGFVGAYRSLLPSGRVTFILGTSDGGQTWQQVNVPSVGVGTIWFSDSLHGWNLTGVAGPPPPPGSTVSSTLEVVYATKDGGLTWSLQTLPDPIIAGTAGCIGFEGNMTARFADANNGWISGVTLCFAPNGTITTQGTLVWTTNDGGANWTVHQLPAGVISIYDRIQVTGTLQMRQPGVLQLSSTSFEQVLIASDDGGATFTETPLPAQNGQIAALTFSDGSHGVLLTSDGHVWRTTDGGATWQGNTLPRFVSSAGQITSYGYRAIESPDGTNIWVTGSVMYGFIQAGFIERSADGGATWTVQLLGSGT
jgi:photosystem II stability/assembly factor-like uncharacterized protein